jgi:hypothetical protein
MTSVLQQLNRNTGIYFPASNNLASLLGRVDCSGVDISDRAIENTLVKIDISLVPWYCLRRARLAGVVAIQSRVTHRSMPSNEAGAALCSVMRRKLQVVAICAGKELLCDSVPDGVDSQGSECSGLRGKHSCDGSAPREALGGPARVVRYARLFTLLARKQAESPPTRCVWLSGP